MYLFRGCQNIYSLYARMMVHLICKMCPNRAKTQFQDFQLLVAIRIIEYDNCKIILTSPQPGRNRDHQGPPEPSIRGSRKKFEWFFHIEFLLYTAQSRQF